ncbi:poly-gamma-glutamate hydrolase family protein [Micromonospora sp. NPDC051196]|uniref:poly-gamma-glutamate hydrolase family protein n=1 Tax=Micromonospora sp. NPDC051196 TaxID=3155281 RepID=UPI003446AA9F
MADLYANFAELSAAEVEGVDYSRTSVRPAGATWASIAIHGGGIEAGSGEVARAVAGDDGRMAYYEFAGLKPADNFDTLHITSTNFDEPQALSLVSGADRILSWHGYAGTTGVAETAIGGLDGRLRDLVAAALTAAGYAVVSAPSEIAGTNVQNICNRGRSGAGVQLEMSRALRESFFPGGDTSRAMRESGQRTAAFWAYVAAVQSVLVLPLSYDPQLSRVRMAGVAPGLGDTFTGRTVVDDWGQAESGQVWLRSGAANAFQVTGGVGQHVLGATNTSRWSLAATSLLDVDVAASVSTGVLATGGGHFLALVARSTDDGATCYLARVEFSATATVILTLRRRVSGTETLISQHTTSLTHVANTPVRVRLQVIGSTLRAKAWLASAPEPATWQLTATDTNVTAAGRVGVRSILSAANTNSLPVTASWDDIATQGQAVVERSTSGIRWSPVRGGLGLDGTAGEDLRLDDYEFVDAVPTRYRVRVVEPETGATLWAESEQITPELGGVWLKSVARPFLNREVIVKDFSAVERAARHGVFAVVGRSAPVVVSDLRGSRQWTVELLTETPAAADDLDLVLAAGDTMLIHTPADCDVPGGYVAIDTVNISRPSRRSRRRVFALPCTEVAAPGPDVVGATLTCQTVLNTYATCADLLAAHATCADLLELIGDPVDVVVP